MGANCPPHTLNLAGHPRKPPQAIAQRRAFRKAACPGSAPRPRINARLPWKREGRTRARSLEVAMQHRAVASAREARRTAPPPASTTHHGSHSPFVGDTPCRAGPRLPCPFGRSRLSAGAAQSSAPQRRAALAVPEPPGLNKEKKEGRTKARTQQTQEQGQEEEEEEEGPGQQQEEAGGANRQGERMRTGHLFARGAARSASRPSGTIESSKTSRRDGLKHFYNLF